MGLRDAASSQWKPERKNAQSTVWKFTITPDGVSLKCYKKSLDHETVLAIAESYRRLMDLIEPYEKAVSA